MPQTYKASVVRPSSEVTRALPALLLALIGFGGACAPQAVNRTSVERAETGTEVMPEAPRSDVMGPIGTGGAPVVSTGGVGGVTGRGGAGGSMDTGPDRGGTGGMVDVPVERPPEIVTEVAPPPDTAEVAPGRVAALVVATPMMLPASDTRLRQLIEMRGFTVKIGDDDAPPADVAGAHVVILSGSCDSEKLAMKYRPTAQPIMVLEPLAFAGMGMTGGSEADAGQQGGNALAMVAATKDHPLAAGITGKVTILTANADMPWGRPHAMAIRIANIDGMAMKAAIFAYTKAAPLVPAMTTAADKRMGFFLGMGAVTTLNANGEKLFHAALDWLAAP